MKTIGLQLNLIPYKGTAPALVDLMADRVDFMCDGLTQATKNNFSNKLVKPVVALTRQRLQSLPDVPTASEVGLKDFEFYNFFALYAPAGLPDQILTKLSKGLAVSMKEDKIINRLEALGAELPPEIAVTPKAARERLNAEIKLWGL